VDAAFHTIRDLLVENPDATVAEIHRTTKIPLDIIERLVQSGRLAYVYSNQCKHCRRTLESSGTDPRLCQSCAQALRNDLVSRMSKRSIQTTGNVNPVPRMHVFSPKSD
jgi:tRNA(Ile2) C34 agmatinyltransferase TiaS